VAGLLFVVVTVVSIILWLTIAGLTRGLTFLSDPFAWSRQFGSDAAYAILSNSAEVIAAVLAIAITVVAIVLELAATRYSHLVTRLFLREPVNAVVLGLLVVTTIQCALAAGIAGDPQAVSQSAQAGFVVTLVLVAVSLLILLPYLYFVFAMLSPISIIERIRRDALRSVRRVEPNRIVTAQASVLRSVEQLQDIGRGAIAQGDRDIAMAAIQGLSSLIYDYVGVKPRLPEMWFEAKGPVAADGDFIALSADQLTLVEQRHIWLEHKIFRQMSGLMGQSALIARDVGNLISIRTADIAKDLGVDDEELLQLCIKAFNSYLRATLNAKDARTMYYIMNQYRGVAEVLLSAGNTDRAKEISSFLGSYGQLAHKAGISFLLEAAAYDVMQLIEHALKVNDDAVDDLLNIFLELDQEIKEEGQEASLLGVRRSQVQVAALFLMQGQEARAERVIDDLRSERGERLNRLRQGLESDNRDEFWELSDRGGNFAYMPPERRPFLAGVYERLEYRT
jgi:predicted membrane protein DUF2254